jgi:hypothetical protein
VLLALAACGGNPVEERARPRVEIVAPIGSVVAGNALQLEVSVTEADGRASTGPVEWRSSDPSVAAVSGGGRVTGIRHGGATITARVDGAAQDFILMVLPPARATTPTSTFLRIASTPGDWVGQGLTRHHDFYGGNWSASAGRERDEVLIRYSSANAWWDLELAAPRGQVLAEGSYENATGTQTEAPGLSFSGTGRGCNTVRGRFTIHDIAIGPGGEVHRLHATFRQHCGDVESYLDGEINIAQYPWR